ncbi:MAG: MarR family transcriptional regulator [Micropruina sp.]|uniref:MarR family winged helix-turn-helix transcriptional regulator n=1 Tax=Micropruina sp. TaxID=2737536 RepID=UPI0039E6D853
MVMNRRTTVLGPLKRAHGAARGLSDEVLRPYGLSTAQYTVLRYVADHPGVSGAALARLIGVTPATMTAMLAALEKDGRVERTPDPAGGRSLQTTMTPQAEELLEQVWPALQWLEEQLLHGIDAADREAFLRVLDRIVARQAELLAPPRLGPSPQAENLNNPERT